MDTFTLIAFMRFFPCHSERSGESHHVARDKIREEP